MTKHIEHGHLRNTAYSPLWLNEGPEYSYILTCKVIICSLSIELDPSPSVCVAAKIKEQ